MDDTTPPPPPPSPAPSPEPPPMSAAADASVPPASPVAETSGVSPNIAATICAALPLVGGIVFLVLEKQNAFVRFWAMQSVFFGGAAFAISILIQVAAFILVLIPLLGWLIAILLGIASIAFGLGVLVIWVITIVKAYSNVEWEIPYLGKLARKQLAGQQLI